MDELDPSSISPLTGSQEKIITILGVIPGILSVLGSSIIVYKVTRNFRLSTPYDRLLLGLSSCDILSSVTYTASPILLNRDTSQRVWASGNQATANMLGFFMQLSFAAIFYNGMLSYYYLLAVKYGVKRKEFARKYEKWMHFGTLGFFLATATVGAIVGFYDEMEVGQGVWVINWPRGCEETETCYSQYIGLVFGGIPTFFTFLSLIVNNVRIYHHVHRNLGVEAVQSKEGDHVIASTTESTVSRMEFGCMEAGLALSRLTNSAASMNIKNDVSRNSGPSAGFFTGVQNSRGSCMTASPTAWIGDKSLHFHSSQSVDSVSQSTMMKRSPRHMAQIREVASQGFLYVASFALAYSAGGALRVLEGMGYTTKDEARIYWLLALDAFLRPLQGFFNVFVYSRPNYIRFRANYPHRSRYWAMRKAFMDPNVPKLPKFGSIADEGNDFCSRGDFDRLAVGPRMLQNLPWNRPKHSRSNISDLPVVKEEDVEEDASSTNTTSKLVDKKMPVGYQQPQDGASRSDHLRSGISISSFDQGEGSCFSQGNNITPSQQQNIGARIDKSTKELHVSPDATMRSIESSNGKRCSENQSLRSSEASVYEDLKLLYQGDRQYQARCTGNSDDRSSPVSPMARMAMDGSVQSLKVKRGSRGLGNDVD